MNMHQFGALAVTAAIVVVTASACGSDHAGAPVVDDGGAVDAADTDGTAPDAGAAGTKVQILAINDFHGALAPVNGAGGAAYLAATVKKLRSKHSIFVSAGDLIGASPLVSGYDHDESTIEVMNAMHLDLHGVGNHEFDEGTAELLRMQHGGCHPVDGCKGGPTFAGASFPFLAANVTVNATQKTLFPGYVIKDFGGVKLAFVGMTLQDTPATTLGSLITDLSFQNEVSTVKALVPEIKAEGVSNIVVIIHQGGAQMDPTGDANSCKSLTGYIPGIAMAMPPEVKVILSGHTHAFYNCKVGGKLVTQAGSNGAYLTDVELAIDPTTQTILSATAKNIPITPDVTPDPDVGAIVSKWNAVVSPIGDAVIGTITADLSQVPSTTSYESPLGDVIADSYLAATSAAGAQIAFMNAGGVRASLPYAKSGPETADGQVRYAEGYSVEPFGNQLVTIDVNGADVVSVLESSAGGGGAPHTAGLIGKFDPVGSPRFSIADITVGGQPLAPNTSYRVTVNSFLVQDTSGFAPLAAAAKLPSATWNAGTDLDALVSYMKVSSPVSPPSPRFTPK